MNFHKKPALSSTLSTRELQEKKKKTFPISSNTNLQSITTRIQEGYYLLSYWFGEESKNYIYASMSFFKQW
jgi:hypothetical protein